MPPQLPSRNLAWDGISFDVPSHWDMASTSVQKNISRMEVEDEYSVRLEAEWLQLRHRPEIDNVRDRYAKAAKALSKGALSSRQLDSLPEGWVAFVYEMPEKHRLVTGFVVASGAPVFLFLKVHFAPEDKEQPTEVMRLIARSFTVHNRGLLPWRVFDVDLETPADFKLIRTVFQAGRKEFSFQWRFRRLHFWQISFADIILRDKTLEEWAATEINAGRQARGRIFSPGATPGELVTRRNRWHPLGHYDEIGRGCFRYLARCHHDTGANLVLIWCFNYRFAGDLEKLAGHLGPLLVSSNTREFADSANSPS